MDKLSHKTTISLAKINRRILNRINLFISLLVFGTGLILFTQFHVGNGAFQKEWFGIGKNVWLITHQVSAVTFLLGFILHLVDHRQYIKKVTLRWKTNLSTKIKSKTRKQTLLFIITIILLWSGFFPWIVMPDATLNEAIYHGWIDIHNRAGIALLLGLLLHIVKRWRYIQRKKEN